MGDGGGVEPSKSRSLKVSKKRISELRALSRKSEDEKRYGVYGFRYMVYPEGVSVTVIFDDAAGRIEYRAHFSGSK